MNYLLDFKYDICEGDVRRAGVLFLELVSILMQLVLNASQTNFMSFDDPVA